LMKSRKPMPFVMLCGLFLLSGCATQTPTPATDGRASFCQIAKVIRFSRLNDTPETIEQIKEHNAVYAKICQ
jgi:hypothetical protein